MCPESQSLAKQPDVSNGDKDRAGRQEEPGRPARLRAYARRVVKVLPLVLAAGAILYWTRLRPVAVEAWPVTQGPIVAEVSLPYRLLAWKGREPGEYIAHTGLARRQPLKLGIKALASVEVVDGVSVGQVVVATPANAGQPTPLDGRRIDLP